MGELNVVTAEAWCALHALDTDYWRRVDRQSDEGVELLYTESGRMQIGALDYAGRDAIRAFFAERNLKEREAARTTRHCGCNLHIESAGDARWRVRSTVFVLSGHGDWPMTSGAPSSVGDFDDRVVRLPDGKWLYEHRLARIVFTGAGAPAFAR